MTVMLWTLVPLAVLALVCGAALTAADSALLTVRRSALERELEDRPRRIRERVQRQYDDAPRTFAATSLATVLAEAIFAVAVTAIVFETMDGWVLTTLLAIAIAGLVTFLAASVSPRTFGRRNPEKVAIALSGLIGLARALLGPVTALLVHIGSALTPGGKVRGGPYATEAELRQFVDRATEAQELEHDERDMIQGVFDLGGTRVREIMVPRTDMVTIGADATARKAMRLFVRSGFSRIPVIGDSADDLLGVLYAKDVMRTIHSPWDPRPELPATDIMRPPMFVPEFVAADDVLRQMQERRIHVAIVVDEYGGVSGIVTIEDVVEEIVGEIADEHDRVEAEIEDLGEGVFRVPARESITTAGELFGLEIEDEDVDTVGGLLAKTLGRVPVPGAEADAHGLHLLAEKTTGRRRVLATVLVGRTPRAEDTPDQTTDPDPVPERTAAKDDDD
ncbi:MAG: hemolysin family protein [Brachybacterium sp.]|nr:hemolysin family protein [Brachybacterium sp.]